MRISRRSFLRMSAAGLGAAFCAAALAPVVAQHEDHADLRGVYTGTYTDTLGGYGGTLTVGIVRQSGHQFRGYWKPDGTRMKLNGRIRDDGAIKMLARSRRTKVKIDAALSEDETTLSGTFTLRERGRTIGEGTFEVVRQP